MKKQTCKYIALLIAGGGLYVLLELIWRGRSHWTMFLLGGMCFICIGLINEVIPWEMPLWKQALIGACIVTALEFLTGCIVNLWLGWDIWDYSRLPGNLLGQVCPQFFLLWIPIVLIAIVLDDWLRYWWFGEDRPYYKIRRNILK